MLEVRGLAAFYGEAIALHDVDVAVGDAEIVAVVGPNGAGKSTLINVLAGLHREHRGRIEMDGRAMGDLPGYRFCERGIAVVPEGRRLFPRMTVGENLDLGAYRSEARADHDSRLEWVWQLFPRLRDRSGQLAGSLSGGEQQMVAIGRALMAQPRLLLLDEPSLGLAPVVVDEVFDVLETIRAAGVAVLLVEQNVDRALAIARRGYLLIEGRVALEGPSADLAASGEQRRSVLGL
jgi:branched-chain amino acid transport system ATP-binding protein